MPPLEHGPSTLKGAGSVAEIENVAVDTPRRIEREAARDRLQGRDLGALWGREFATRRELEDVVSNTLAERWVDGPVDSLADTRWWIDLGAAYLAALESVRGFLARPEGRPRQRWAYAFVDGFVEGAALVLAQVGQGAAGRASERASIGSATEGAVSVPVGSGALG